VEVSGCVFAKMKLLMSNVDLAEQLRSLDVAQPKAGVGKTVFPRHGKEFVVEAETSTTKTQTFYTRTNI
jgi:hypothetical protein